jgi:hypothetical protein
LKSRPPGFVIRSKTDLLSEIGHIFEEIPHETLISGDALWKNRLKYRV